MGWTGGTEIINQAVHGADAAALALLNHYGVEIGLKGLRVELHDEDRRILDDVLRPHVRAICDKLVDKDWDPEGVESYYFERFSQEMLGYDDDAYEGWLRHALSQATHDGTVEQILAAAQRLKNHTDKMKAGES